MKRILYKIVVFLPGFWRRFQFFLWRLLECGLTLPSLLIPQEIAVLKNQCAFRSFGKKNFTSLKEKGLVKSADAFYYAARFNVFDRTKPFSLKSGSYTLSTSMGMKEIYQILQSGASEYISVVVPEGLTMSKLQEFLRIKIFVLLKISCFSAKIQSFWKNIKFQPRILKATFFPTLIFYSPNGSERRC